MHANGISGYPEEDFLQLSGLQHFLFCRRQWALIHVENLWAENLRTIDGQIMHERAHDETYRERRGNTVIARGISVKSSRLGVSGQCDVVEFHRDEAGVSIHDLDGLWIPFPVEYKNGEPKENNCDAAQLCGQAMCLEEMLCCKIERGALFYGKTKRRFPVEFTKELRQEIEDALQEMHQLHERGYTPKVKRTKACNACSLKEVCLPALMKIRSVKDYMEENL
ncbi:CRISPR-associated protein Cas4 [Scatolibacter rhodanostii]|uniref:CRISPR-associated protein Cas4 n=1 Tax=Scatolibacter rhodanostii TaxID=2014781 RepID=UPI000C06BC9B|nr:CRISPR-associated protein Cas4 [Scatolibacter rhodanostii]